MRMLNEKWRKFDIAITVQNRVHIIIIIMFIKQKGLTTTHIA